MKGEGLRLEIVFFLVLILNILNFSVLASAGQYLGSTDYAIYNGTVPAALSTRLDTDDNVFWNASASVYYEGNRETIFYDGGAITSAWTNLNWLDTELEACTGDGDNNFLADGVSGVYTLNTTSRIVNTTGYRVIEFNYTISANAQLDAGELAVVRAYSGATTSTQLYIDDGGGSGNCIVARNISQAFNDTGTFNFTLWCNHNNAANELCRADNIRISGLPMLSTVAFNLTTKPFTETVADVTRMDIELSLLFNQSQTGGNRWIDILRQNDSVWEQVAASPFSITENKTRITKEFPTDAADISTYANSSNHITIRFRTNTIQKGHAGGVNNAQFNVVMDFLNLTTTAAVNLAPQSFAVVQGKPNGTTYSDSRNFGFQARWTDNTNPQHVTFESNISGAIRNYSNYTTPGLAGCGTTSVYCINFTGLQTKGAFSYYYRWFANDSANQQNSTSLTYFNISRGATAVSLFMNDSTTNTNYTQNEVANFTAIINTTGLTINLTSNYTGWVNLAGTTTIFNTTNLTTTGLNWNITTFFIQNDNYTTTITSLFFNVSVPTPPAIAWNQSTKNLGTINSGSSSSGNVTARSTGGTSTNVLINESQDTCNCISFTPDSVSSLGNNQQREVRFTAAPSTGLNDGSMYFAIVNVTSTQDSSADQINVSFIYNAEISGSVALDMGEVSNATSESTAGSVSATGTNTNVRVFKSSGNGTNVIHVNNTDIGTLLGGTGVGVNYICNPPPQTALGYYIVNFVINSTEHKAGLNTSVACRVAFSDRAPLFRNFGQNVSQVFAGHGIKLFAQGFDDRGLHRAFLSTNESGIFVNYTGEGGGGAQSILSFQKYRPVGWQTSGTVTEPENATDKHYNDSGISGTSVVIPSGTSSVNYTYDLPSVDSATLFYVAYRDTLSGGTADVYNFSSNSFYRVVVSLTAAAITRTVQLNITSGLINSTGHAILKITNTASDNLNIDDTHTTLPGDTYNYSNITSPNAPDMYAANWTGASTSCDLIAICIGEIEFNNAAYTAIAQDDTTYTQIVCRSCAVGQEADHLIHLKVEESISNINSVTVRYQGFASSSTLTLYIFNNSMPGWQNMTVIGTSTTGIYYREYSGAEVSDVVDSSGYVNLKVATPQDGSVTANTDYAEVNVNHTAAAAGGGPSLYSSPLNLLNTSNNWTWTNFSWSNTTIVDKVVAWRIWYEDNSSKTTATPIRLFFSGSVIRDRLTGLCTTDFNVLNDTCVSSSEAKENQTYYLNFLLVNGTPQGKINQTIHLQYSESNDTTRNEANLDVKLPSALPSGSCGGNYLYMSTTPTIETCAGLSCTALTDGGNPTGDIRIQQLSPLNASPYYVNITYPITFCTNTTGKSFDFGHRIVSSAVGNLIPDSYITIGVSAIQKWGYNLTASIYSSPATADINGDGVIDVIFGSDENKVYAVSGNNGTNWWNYSTGDAVFSSPSIGDLDNDGDLEVVFGSFDKNITAVNSTGGRVWNFTADDLIGTSAALVDLNNDNALEVVIGSCGKNLYVINGTSGALLWNYSAEDCIWASPVVADITNDGIKEIAFGSYDGKIYLLNGSVASMTKAQRTLWSFNFSNTTATYHQLEGAPAIGDVDNDGTKDVIFGTYNGISGGNPPTNYIYVLNGGSGAQIWNYSVGFTLVGSAPVLSDINGDGFKEVIVGTQSPDKRIYALVGLNGTKLWDYQTNGHVDSSPAIADLNGDGIKDVIAGSSDNFVYVINGKDGAFSWRFNAGGSIYTSPAITDLNSDGRNEIVVGTTTNNRLITIS